MPNRNEDRVSWLNIAHPIGFTIMWICLSILIAALLGVGVTEIFHEIRAIR